MPDYGHTVAEKAIDSTGKKVARVYGQAAKELKGKLKDFNAKHKAKQKEMLAQLKDGKITQAAYDSWMRGQVFIGKQWQDKLDSAVKVMQNANAEAAMIVDQGKLHVFAENYNYAAYDLEKKANGVVSFNMYDEDTVGRLLKDKPQMLPKWKIDEPKDYKWNRQKVENSITQGIIQGEGIDQITDRLVDALVTTNENRMRTFARTSMTGAQNAGRQKQMEDAEDMGIKVKKQWLATLDDRTRDTHQRLDGKSVPVDQPFEIDGMEIMYPGDPSAEPELVYNCRCTMIEVYEGIDRESTRRAYYSEGEEGYEEGKRNSYEVKNMTYSEWKEAKQNGTAEQPAQEQKQNAQTLTIAGKQVDQDGRLVVDDAAQIEEGKKENEERARQIKEKDQQARESYKEAVDASREQFELRREYARGDITAEEYTQRNEVLARQRREAEIRSSELARERDKLQRDEHFSCNSAKLVGEAEKKKVDYDAPKVLETPRTTEEIVSVLGGGDMTDGSCASLGFCYVGQTEGIDVVDFRGGSSQELFSHNAWGMLYSIAEETGKPLIEEATKTGTGGAIRLIKQMQEGKEYYVITGRHASIMRKAGDMVEYMELQSATSSGWRAFGSHDDRGTLDRMFRHRFGSSTRISGKAVMMDIDDMKGSKILHRALGYMNTAVEAQKKGSYGSIK